MTIASVNSSAAPAKSRKHENAGIFRVLRGDIFLGDEIHAVAQRRDEADPRLAMESGEARACRQRASYSATAANRNRHNGR